MSSNIFDPVNFLFKRKYGHISLAPYPITPLGSPIPPNDDFNRESHNKLLGKVKAYKSELAALPREELEALVKIESQKQSEKRKREDARLFFNAPISMADFSYWSIQPYWTHEEAVALLLGKSPEVVTRKNMYSYSHDTMPSRHPVVEKYHRFLDLIGRAIEVGILSNKSSPLDYAEYARSYNIDIPVGLIESFSGQKKLAFAKLSGSKKSNTLKTEPDYEAKPEADNQVQESGKIDPINNSLNEKEIRGIEEAVETVSVSKVGSNSVTPIPTERKIIPITPPKLTNDFYDEAFLPAVHGFERENNFTPNKQEIWNWLIEKKCKGYKVSYTKANKTLHIGQLISISKKNFNDRYNRYYPKTPE